VGPEPDAYVFAGEKGTPVWRDTLLYDHIRAKLKPRGLGWVDFQVMRRTHASIGHRLKLDPKVTADQRGHGVGVSIEEYTKATFEELPPRTFQFSRLRSRLFCDGDQFVA
jgi:hypothetical protein